MASITLTGTLLDPTGEDAVGDQIRFTHRTTTGDTIKFARSLLIIPPDGSYNITLEFGLILVEYLDVKDVHFKNLGIVTVNQDSTATSLPELLNAIVPPTDEQLLEFQSILADCVTAQDNAAISETNAATSAAAAAVSESTLKRHPAMFDAMAFYAANPPANDHTMETMSFHLNSIYSNFSNPYGAATYIFDSAFDKALHNGGTIIDPLNTADLSVWQLADQTTWFTAGTGAGCWILTSDSRDTRAGQFGAIGSKRAENFDNFLPLQAAIDATPVDSTLLIETGFYRVTQELDCGGKVIYIRGEGLSYSLKDSGNRDIRGTIINSESPDYIMRFDVLSNFIAQQSRSRFSTLKDITLFGNGTSVAGVDQRDGTNRGIKIGNLGIHLDNVFIKHVLIGIDVHRCVGAKWGKVILDVAGEGLVFPSEVGRDTFTTASDFGYVTIFGDITNPSNIALRQDSQNQFGGNTGYFNIESSYNGAQFEATNAGEGIGKGSAAWDTKSTFVFWIEAIAAAGFHIRELSDSALIPQIEYTQYHESPVSAAKRIVFQGNWETSLNHILPMLITDNDRDSGTVGSFDDRVGGGKFHVSGIERNSVLARDMKREVIPFTDFDRVSKKVLGRSEFTYMQESVPNTAVKTITFQLGVESDFKAFILTVDFVGMSGTGLFGYIASKIVYKYNDSGTLEATPIYDNTSRFELTHSINTATNFIAFYISLVDAEVTAFNGSGSVSVTASGSNLNNFEMDLIPFV